MIRQESGDPQRTFRKCSENPNLFIYFDTIASWCSSTFLEMFGDEIPGSKTLRCLRPPNWSANQWLLASHCSSSAARTNGILGWVTVSKYQTISNHIKSYQVRVEAVEAKAPKRTSMMISDIGRWNSVWHWAEMSPPRMSQSWGQGLQVPRVQPELRHWTRFELAREVSPRRFRLSPPGSHLRKTCSYLLCSSLKIHVHEKQSNAVTSTWHPLVNCRNYPSWKCIRLQSDLKSCFSASRYIHRSKEDWDGWQKHHSHAEEPIVLDTGWVSWMMGDQAEMFL